MSETVYADDSMPPIVGSSSSFLEPEGPEIYETSSATTTDDIEFNQNHGDADNLTDDDDDLPSLRDILEWNWKRNPEVNDLTAEGDVDSSLSAPRSPALEITIAQMIVAPALNSAVTPPQSMSPTQPSGSSTTRMAGTVSSVAQTPRKTPFKKIPWWSAFQDKPLQTSVSTSDPQDSDAAGLVVEAESDSERESDGDRPTTRHLLSLLDEDSDVASEVCNMAPSTNLTWAEDITMGRHTVDAASHPSSSMNAESFEIPETPSATENMRCPGYPSVVRVMDKRLDTERPQYLVLCWMYPQEGEAANSELDRHFREYDEKVSRNLVRQERLSTLRARKRIPTDSQQNPDRARKRARIQATASASQSRNYPSRQVEEDFA